MSPIASAALVATTLALTLAPARAEPLRARTTASRPVSVMLESGFGGPVGIYGLTVGYHLDPAFELAGGFGLGFTGYQAAVLARYAVPVGGSPTMSWVFGAGPSLALRSEALGFHIEQATPETVIDPDELFFTAWLNAELGWEGRATWGGTLRFVLGAGLRLADNQRQLCEGVPTGEPGSNDCNPMHFGPGSIYARAVVLPYFAMSFGWAF